MVENPYIPSLNLPGPGQRLRSAVQEVGAPMFEGGPVRTSIPYAEASAKFYDPPNGIVGVPGAFSRVYVNDDGHTMLQGGMVYGGTGAPIEVPNYQLLASGGTPPVDGTHVRIDIDVTANEDDGVIVPGCEADSASISNGTPTATTTPEDGSPEGSISLSLGIWIEDEFQPSGLSGNILVVHYLGTLKIERA